MTTTHPAEVECRRMPSFCRQRGTSNRADRAFIKVNGERHYLGAFDDPSTREMYARMKGFWERSGLIDLPMIYEPLTKSVFDPKVRYTGNI